MAESTETAAQRITSILNDMQIRIFGDFDTIRAIVQEEQGRYEEDSEKDQVTHASRHNSSLEQASLATTGRHVTALHNAENTHGEDLARLFGMEE
ncbi:MAG: hypothetical protein ACLQUY_23460 [Ktedonobacterales bacterium]